MRSIYLLIAAVTLTGISVAEKRVKRSDLPARVQRTADAESIGGTVVGYSMDTEDGRVKYEVHLMVNGHWKDVTIDPSGKVLEVEEQVEIDSLPFDVVSGLRQEAGQRKITEVESLTKHGEIVAYEAQVESGGKHSEVQVGPHGERPNHNE